MGGGEGSIKDMLQLKKVAIRWVVLLSILLFCGQAWGADYVDTAEVVYQATPNENSFSVHPLETNDWENIEEIPADEDTTYDYHVSVGGKLNFVFKIDWDTTGGIIDSITLQTRGKYVGGTTGTSAFTLWRKIYTTETGWLTCTPWDTVTLTSTYENHSITWAQDPCTDANWVWSYIDSLGDYPGDVYFCWGIRNYSIRSGFPVFTGNRITQALLIVYWHTEEAEGKRKTGGIIRDGDNRGIIEGGIAR